MTLRFRLAGALCFAALLAGCDALEPYQRAYSWHPTGIYDANLATMVVNPADLVHGHGASATDGSAAATAIDRLRQNHVKPLLDVGSATPATALSAN